MITPVISVQLGKRFHQLGSQWIQMNISDQFLEIGTAIPDVKHSGCGRELLISWAV
jgi:hypothetical protein